MAGARRARTLAAAAAMLVALAVAPGMAAPVGAQQDTALRAVLQGLDKTTARVSTIEAPIDGIARFGTLEIVARACHKKPPTETPESAAFLEIVDVRPDSPAVRVFTGWMFASSPAISALEHPVYDVRVVDCRSGPLDPLPAGEPTEPAPLEELPEGIDIPIDSEAAPAD